MGALHRGCSHQTAAGGTEPVGASGLAWLDGHSAGMTAPWVKVRIDNGDWGLATAFPDQLGARPASHHGRPAEKVAAWRQAALSGPQRGLA